VLPSPFVTTLRTSGLAPFFLALAAGACGGSEQNGTGNARNALRAHTAPATDAWSTARPQGAAFDLGAHEYGP
jgi:hypothetical protein